MTAQNNIPLIVSLLLSGKSVSQTAKAANVSTRTVCRMRQSEEFKKEFQLQKRELVRSVIDQLSVNAAPAVQTLRKIFSDHRASSAARVSASATTIRLTLQGFELAELADRITALEEALRVQSE